MSKVGLKEVGLTNLDMNSDMNNNKQTITSGDCYSQKGDDCFPISFGILREKGSYLPDLLTNDWFLYETQNLAEMG